MEVSPLRLPGYVAIETGHATATTFQIHDPDPVPATQVIEQKGHARGWQVFEA